MEKNQVKKAPVMLQRGGFRRGEKKVVPENSQNPFKNAQAQKKGGKKSRKGSMAEKKSRKNSMAQKE